MTYALQGLAPLRVRIAAWMPQWGNSVKKEGIIWSEGKKHHAISQPSEASSQKAIPSPTLPKKNDATINTPPPQAARIYPARHGCGARANGST